jgi:hypothetical protein
MQHHFFECPLHKTIWCIVRMTFCLAPPKKLTNLFGNWLTGIPKKDVIKLELEFALSYGLFGILKIILC